MQLHESVKLFGVYELKLKARDGQIKDSRLVYNVITTAGIANMAAILITDVGGTAFDYLAVGTGNTAATNTQTALVGETHRIPSAGSRATTTLPNDTSVLAGTFSFTGSFALAECAVLGSTAAGLMLSRQTYSVINVTSGDSLVMTYKVSFA